MRKPSRSILLAAILLAGCGRPAYPPTGPEPTQVRAAGPPVVHDSWKSCTAEHIPAGTYDSGEAAQLTAEAGRLPLLTGDFTAVAAVVCTAAPPGTSGGAGRRIDRVTDLVAALRLPDVAPSGGACLSIQVFVYWFALLDADGHWIRPGVPFDECRKPRQEVLDALLKPAG